MKKLNIQELGRMSQEQFKLSRKVPVIIVLDNVRSIYNVGSIFRTADAFRIECICLCGITSTPVNSLIEIQTEQNHLISNPAYNQDPATSYRS